VAASTDGNGERPWWACCPAAVALGVAGHEAVQADTARLLLASRSSTGRAVIADIPCSACVASWCRMANSAVAARCGDESHLIAQAVYLQSASMCVSTEVRDGRPVKEDEATQGHGCLLRMPENTYVLEERSDRHHTIWHVSWLGNVDTVTALVGWEYVSRGAIPGLWDIEESSRKGEGFRLI
jgi:hypothetical protein